MKLISKYVNENKSLRIYTFDDGTKLRIHPKNKNITELETIDLCISKKCSIGCPFCYQGACKEGKIATIESLNFILENLPNSVSEIAVGGGALSECDGLLEKLCVAVYNKRISQNRIIILNITINAAELINSKKFLEKINFLYGGVVKGVGVSYNREFKKELLDAKQKFPNLVIHTIAGVTEREDYEWLAKNNFKILILGYKTVGRGESYLDKNKEKIINNQKELESMLPYFKEMGVLVSFDCLAVKQLHMASHVPPEKWEKLFMGDDGEHSMYIDAVDMTAAVSSSTKEQNINITKEYLNNNFNFNKLFEKIKQMRNKNC